MNVMGNDRNAPATKGDLEDLETRLKGEISGVESKISGLETRLKGEISGVESKISGLETRLKGEMSEVETRLKAEMSEAEARLTEKMRDMQTELLHAFYGFTESVQSRFKAQDDTEAGLKHRLTVLETRLLDVERRLNTPPAA
jgi:predicted transcriptional regulator with HTH domain